MYITKPVSVPFPLFFLAVQNHAWPIKKFVLHKKEKEEREERDERDERDGRRPCVERNKLLKAHNRAVSLS